VLDDVVASVMVARTAAYLPTDVENNPGTMVTRKERIDAFSHEGAPPTDLPLELLCEDHVGTYVIPFLCRWNSGTWHSVDTDNRIEATVVGWRVR
jgi:hypothetical protein